MEIPLTREQVSDIIDTLEDRMGHLDTLREEIPEDAEYFIETFAELEEIRKILQKALETA